MFFRKDGIPITKIGNLFSDFKEKLFTKYIEGTTIVLKGNIT